MPPHWRARKKSEWNMGTYETTELDHQAIDWCIRNGIKIAPFAKQPGEWYIDITVNNKTNRSPHIYGKDVCLLYTSPSPRDRQKSRMPSSA